MIMTPFLELNRQLEIHKMALPVRPVVVFHTDALNWFVPSLF